MEFRQPDSPLNGVALRQRLFLGSLLVRDRKAPAGNRCLRSRNGFFDAGLNTASVTSRIRPLKSITNHKDVGDR
jgi:hypothetical protein